MSTFKIDFFEFAFLVEACIPPRPIARSMFWDNVIDEHHEKMTKDERAHLFEWIERNPNFDIDNEKCKVFHDRFDPDNQYLVHTMYKGKEESKCAFKHEEKYHLSTITSILDEYITKVEKL